MKVNQSKSIWNWYLKLFNDNSANNKNSAAIKKGSGSTNRDTIIISREAKFSQIEKTVESGKPLTGVSFEQYCKEYYFSSLNTAPKGGIYEARREYNQAVRGTNDIIAKQDWYGKDIILSPQIVNSEGFQKHINELAQKWSEGDKLSDKQLYLLKANDKLYLDAAVKNSLKLKANQLKSLISEQGVLLEQNERVKISLYGDKFKVSGDFSEDKRIAIEHALNSLTKNEKTSFKVLYTRENTSSYVKNISKQERMLSSSIEEVEYLLDSYSGGKVSLRDLSINSKGQIEGLPNALMKYFDGVTSEKDYPIETENISERNKIMTKRVQKEAFERSIYAIEKQGFDNLPRYTFEFELSDSQLKAIDIYE